MATAKPALGPWFDNDDPSTGAGFEAALAYQLASRMGLPGAKVTWAVKQLADTSGNPSAATGFDVALEQLRPGSAIGRTATMSVPYYAPTQAVIALRSQVPRLATLLSAHLGDKAGRRGEAAKNRAPVRIGKVGKVGIVGIGAAPDQVRRALNLHAAPTVYADPGALLDALRRGTIKAAVMSLPDATALTLGPRLRFVGQFRVPVPRAQQFAMLLPRGSGLTSCVNAAITQIRDSGELRRLEQRWLVDRAGVPWLSAPAHG